uniref:Uncharacterized protein n=1 Tax=Lactuca sativa TaxID=4236 RepID=A0A9R1WJP9_LACSA|nr:hypothetical protein LSAT_V11C100005310 [Lactuca sativa]
MWKSAFLLRQNVTVRCNILSYNMITATFHSQTRFSSPQMNYELTDSVLSFKGMIETIPVPPVRQFNHILIKIAKMKQYPTAISLILDHDLLGFNSSVKPNLYTFSIAINCFCHTGRVDLGFSVYGKVVKLGYKPDSAIINTLIRGLCDNGNICEALKFSEMNMNNGLQPTVVTFGTIINGICKKDGPQAAHRFLQLVEETKGFHLGATEYNTIINGLCKDRHLTEAREIYFEMEKKGILPDVITFNSLIQGYCNLGLWEKVNGLSTEMKDQGISYDVVTFSILVHYWFKQGRTEEAHKIIKLMLESGMKPDTYMYTSVIHGYCLLRKVDYARKIFTFMIAQGCVPSAFTYTTLINGYCLVGKVDEAREIFEVMIQEGYAPCVVSYSILIEGYCKSKKKEKIEKAWDLFSEMYGNGIVPNVVTCTSLINGLCHVGRLKEAFQLLKDIPNWGIYPNIFTYSTLIDSYLKNEKMDEALKLFKTMECIGIKPDIVVCTSLIDGMCRAGKVDGGYQVFLRLAASGLHPNCHTYNVLMGGFFKHGYLKDVNDLIQEMEVEGCMMDGVTYNLVIQGFLQHNETKRALLYLESMLDVGFSANASTTTKLVYLLATKHLNRASKELLKKLDVVGFWTEGEFDSVPICVLLQKSMELNYIRNHKGFFDQCIFTFHLKTHGIQPAAFFLPAESTQYPFNPTSSQLHSVDSFLDKVIGILVLDLCDSNSIRVPKNKIGCDPNLHYGSYVHQTNKYCGASLDHELEEPTEQKFSPWRVYGISCEDKQAGRRKVDNAIIWWNWNSRFPSAIYLSIAFYKIATHLQLFQCYLT